MADVLINITVASGNRAQWAILAVGEHGVAATLSWAQSPTPADIREAEEKFCDFMGCDPDDAPVVIADPIARQQAAEIYAAGGGKRVPGNN